MPQQIIEVPLEEELKNSYLDYAMSVIVSRALPDVRDGLKPVQRRILYAMQELNLTPTNPYRKSAKVTGEVTANFHPHGTAAVYEALARLAQDFSLRYPLIDGQGNFGSIDGDPPAAERYTEVRLSSLAMELLKDIDKDTIDFLPNYDNSRKEPTVLPALLPNLLINGTMGIAVGMISSIPPHNLGEVVDAIIYTLNNPEVSVGQLLKIIKGPDFPGGGEVIGGEQLEKIYSTGRGQITVRSKIELEEGDRRIVLRELPYQVNKAALVMRIAELVKQNKITDIVDLRDESDRNGLRVVLELSEHAQPHIIINQLYKYTQAQVNFVVQMLALVDGVPRIVSLKELIQHYINHRLNVTKRRINYELRTAKQRLHILEALQVVLLNVDSVIKLIRQAYSPAEAKENLTKHFNLSSVQAEAILQMPLQRLTRLQREKIEQESASLVEKVKELEDILAEERKVINLIKQELLEIKEKYKNPRQTKIIYQTQQLHIHDLIPDRDVVICISKDGYIKCFPVDSQRLQRRGGVGSQIYHSELQCSCVVSVRHRVVFLTNKGRAYSVEVHTLPQGKQIKGKPITTFIKFKYPNERVIFGQAIEKLTEKLLLVSGKGNVKCIDAAVLRGVHRDGIYVMKLREGDFLAGVDFIKANEDFLIVTANGQCTRVSMSELRETSRLSIGVKGIKLKDNDQVIGVISLHGGENLILISEYGYSKRIAVGDIKKYNRPAMGVKVIKLTPITGKLISAVLEYEATQLILFTACGLSLRINSSQLPLLSRYSRGIKTIKLKEGDKVSHCTPIYE